MREVLLERFSAFGLEISPEQAEKFCLYHAMLGEANARFNLTRVPEEISEAVDRNYLDSACALKIGLLSDAQRIVDVGTGAGFPGIPLAILLPEREFTLLDALGKRVEFLREVIDRLGLNARAVKMRAEEAGRSAQMREQFDLAVSRAVAPMRVLAELMLPLVRVGGGMLAYKGPGLGEEMEAAQTALELLGGRAAGVFPAEIPGRDWRHALAQIEKVRATPEKYPRRVGIPEKRPL